ncbi:MAG: TlpA disulfide reductase family protein [Phycisphaerales bacterium]
MRKPTLAASLAVTMMFACLWLPTPSASAQQMPDAPQAEAAPSSPEARAALERAAVAVQKLDSLSAHVALAGGGSDMFVKFMPSAEATLTARRNDPDESGQAPQPWTTRVVGVGRDRSDTGEEYGYDFAFDGKDITWVEHDSKSVKTCQMDRARGSGFSLREHLNLDELLAAEPLSRELAPGATYALEDRQTLDGVECDVVLVTYAEETDRRPSRRAKHNKSRWFLSVKDSMPRRLERIHDTAYRLSLDLTITDVKLNTPLAASDMKVRVPEGYEEIDQRMTAPRIGSVRPNPSAIDRQPDAAISRPTPADPTANRHAAPAFELRTPTGETYTLEGQKGKITVLYFWGTWCVPCHEFSPLVSKLVDTFAGEPVSVLAPTFMETAPGAASDMVAKGGYKYTLLVNADEMRKDYKVRVAPTIDVIDPEGRLIIRETNSKEESPEEIMQRVERTIREELARMQGG